MDKLVKEQDMTEGDARIEATNLEIKFLREEQQKLDLSTNPRTSKANKPGDLKKFENDFSFSYYRPNHIKLVLTSIMLSPI